MVVLTTHFMDEADLLGDRVVSSKYCTMSCVARWKGNPRTTSTIESILCIYVDQNQIRLLRLVAVVVVVVVDVDGSIGVLRG